MTTAARRRVLSATDQPVRWEDVLEIRQIHHTDIGHSGEIHLTVIHIAIIHHIQCLLHAVLADADLIGQMDHLSRVVRK